jgi:hypothetical protein
LNEATVDIIHAGRIKISLFDDEKNNFKDWAYSSPLQKVGL